MYAPRSISIATCALLLALSACKKDESNLAKMAEAGEEQQADGGPSKADSGGGPEGADSAGDSKATTAADEGGSADEGGAGLDGPAPELPLDAHGLPIPALEGSARLITAGADERVTLRLALDEGARYRITTIGMLKLPLIEKPTGFAREEELRLSECKGEGAERTCLVTHEYRNYEAEPPTGTALEKDEAAVAGLTSSHRVDASGLRITETAVIGDNPEQVQAPAGQALGQVHRLFCLRLPAEPVGEGASWRDTCRMRQGGSVVTRELTWRLAKLEASEEGTRAELAYAGRARKVDSRGETQSGEVAGILYFWVDAGEPHMMRERVAFVIDAERGVGTGTDFRYQFTKVGEDGETLIRTDGKPFEQPPQALNELRSVPKGSTRDGELPGQR